MGLSRDTSAGGVLRSGTAVASTSGTSIDFTSIPSWVKRITVMFNGVSTSGSSQAQIQLGSTSFSTSGYISNASFGTTSSSYYGRSTTGFMLEPSGISASTLVRYGSFQLILINNNTWVGSGNLATDAGLVTSACAGTSPNLSGSLDRVRITTVNGTDTFDAGTINILYE